MKILLDSFFRISSIEATPEASTAFLKQVLILCEPKSGQEANVGDIFLCTSNSEVAVRTDNTDAAQLFSAGMSRVYVMLVDDLDISAYIEGHESDQYTILVSSDFNEDDVVATQASGTITVTSYANLLTTTPDTVTIQGEVFTAQSGPATLGTATFRAATDNDTTAASLAAQINAYEDFDVPVVATVVGPIVTLKAAEGGSAGNDITLTYADVGTASIGITLAGLSGGKLSGGDGLYVGDFAGVVGVWGTDDAKLATQAAIANRAAFHSTSSNKAKNMFYAFGKMLSNALNWRNQQYITMPVADDVESIGDADALFDENISFVLTDDEFGQRLGLFAAGGKAIVAPYIIKNLQVDMQSAALTYVSGNQPAYTLKEAALLEDELQKVIESYITIGWITDGVVSITLEADNFVASGNINVAEPKALWRIFAEMRQTL